VSAPASNVPVSSVWKISKDGNSLFLGGSIHVLRSEDFPLPKVFDLAFEQSAMLVLETDVEQMSDDKIAQYLMAQMFLPGDKTLRSILDSDTYKMLQEKCAEYGFSVEDVSKFKPSMVLTMLSIIDIQKFGFVQEGVDQYYLQKAKKMKKSLGFLETMESQIDMLVTMGDRYENDFVRYSLFGMDNTDNNLDSIVSEWKKGVASSTERELMKMREQWPIIYKTLLTDRNAAWLPQINSYLTASSPVFVIVGLAHLHGPDGLLKQLADSGCTVEQFR
jgi:uncharacterized protein YbaP (TraB family)